MGVLVSGRGSNLESILKALRKGEIKGADVSVVISNKPGVRALRIAEKFAVRTAVLPPKNGEERSSYDSRLREALLVSGVDQRDGLVLLAGFMRLLSPEFVKYYEGRIMNIHPSLLPSFPGLDAQKQALEHGAKVAGCTVHFVVPAVDAGPIILQRAVPVKAGDTVETLSARILEQEHRVYPLAVKLFVEGKLSIKGRSVVVRS